jgi:hypothetical protein
LRRWRQDVGSLDDDTGLICLLAHDLED